MNMWINTHVDSERERESLSHILVEVWIIFMEHFFPRFPLSNHFELPSSKSIFGISKDPPMCAHASLSQDGFYQKGVWVKDPLTVFPFLPPRRLLAHVWGGDLTPWMRNMWFGKGPTPSVNIHVLVFQSIWNESSVALPWKDASTSCLSRDPLITFRASSLCFIGINLDWVLIKLEVLDGLHTTSWTVEPNW